jgi:transposase
MKRLLAQTISNLATDHEQIWLRPGETPPERARHTIQDRKIMVTIAWNPLGFPLIVALPKGRPFNAEYYRDNILAALTQFQPEHDGRKLIVHADNATAHIAQKCRTFCEENGLWFALHPPYSSVLAPSDFFLFGYTKERLKGMLFPSYEELLDAISEVVTGIESETWTTVFEHWIDRLEWDSKNNGDYYPSTTSRLIYFSPMSIRNRVAKPECDTLNIAGAKAESSSTRIVLRRDPTNGRRPVMRLINDTQFILTMVGAPGNYPVSHSTIPSQKIKLFEMGGYSPGVMQVIPYLNDITGYNRNGFICLSQFSEHSRIFTF